MFRPVKVELLVLVAPAEIAVLDAATCILSAVINPLRILRFSMSEVT